MKEVIVNLNKEEVFKTILKNKQIDDKIYFITIKDLVGSGSLKQLKYHCKRALKNCFKKDNTFLKFDYLSTIQNDEDNYKDNIFLKQEFAYHNHTLAITKLTKNEIELGIENYHLRFSEKKIDIRINQINETFKYHIAWIG